MFFKGLKLGMVLQLAIGPVCLYIFNLGIAKGFFTATAGVLAVVMVDAIYVLLAILGIVSFIQNRQVEQVFKIIGALVVAYFGLSIIAGAFGFSIMPELKLCDDGNTGGAFLKVFFLTVSNPLTILFWIGIFATKITSEQVNRESLYLFGSGAVAAGFLFLTAVALAGSIAKIFIPVVIVKLLNVLVGLILIYFAFAKVLKKS